jgi:hypothetical protein
MWIGGALGPVRPDAKKAYLASLTNFPTNTEIDTRLTYAAGRPETLFLPNVPDSRAIQVGVSWSIRELPAEPMMPRIADDRVGYFTTSHKDFTKEKGDFCRQWRMGKDAATPCPGSDRVLAVHDWTSTCPR